MLSLFPGGGYVAYCFLARARQECTKIKSVRLSYILTKGGLHVHSVMQRISSGGAIFIPPCVFISAAWLTFCPFLHLSPSFFLRSDAYTQAL